MSFLGSSNKNQDGFHVVLEVLDNSLLFHLVAVNGGSYSELASVALKHHTLPNNGLTENEVKNFIAMVNKGFKELGIVAVKKIGKSDKIKIKNATTVIFYPWFVSEKKDDIVIGKPGETNHLSAKGIEEALSQTDLTNLGEGHAIAAYTLKKSIVEIFVNSIKLNGYVVSDPVGKKAKDIRVGASFYTASLAMLDALKKEIHFHTGVDPEVITFPRACALYARNHSLKPGTLFIDIENETTSVCTVSNESSLVYNAETFDMGLSHIIEAVMERSEVEREVAESYMRLSYEELLVDDLSLLVKGAEGDSLSLWKSKVDSFLSNSTATNEKFIICREPKFEHLFMATLNFELSVDIRKIVFESSFFSV